MKKNNKIGGISILGIFILGIIFILVLNFFNVKIKFYVDNSPSSNNFEQAKGEYSGAVADYIQKVISTTKKIWTEYFWGPFISNMNNMMKGESTDLQQSLPSVSY